MAGSIPREPRQTLTAAIARALMALALTGKPSAAMTFDDYLTVYRRLGWDQPRVEHMVPPD